MGDWGAGNWGDWGDWGAGNCRKGFWSLRVKWEKKNLEKFNQLIYAVYFFASIDLMQVPKNML